MSGAGDGSESNATTGDPPGPGTTDDAPGPDGGSTIAPPGTPTRRFLAVLALVALPWTVLVLAGEFAFVLAVGLVNTNPLHLTTLPDYVFRFTGPGGFAGLPASLQAWPVSVACYLGALGSALGGLFGREDPRLTAGLLVLVGLGQGSLALGLSRRVGQTALPLGAFAAWVLAWWYYWPAITARSR